MSTWIQQGWEDDANARAYASFARRYSMYTDTSEALVQRVSDRTSPRSAVDVGCGTGVTTRALLACFSEIQRITGVDGSAAMLREAELLVGDRRVSWVQTAAEDLADVATGPFDVAVCNSAIWQMDLRRTIRAISRVLSADGVLAFNVSAQYLKGVAPRTSGGSSSLVSLLRQVASETVGDLTSPPARPPRPALTPEAVTRALSAEGFGSVDFTVEQFRWPIEQDVAYLAVPMLTEAVLPGLTPAQRQEALEQVRLLAQDWQPTVSFWGYFTAIR